jgi:hypothetical protein
MLPIPFLKYFPKLYQNDPKAQFLASKMDSIFTAIKNDILGLKRLNRADECPAQFLSELDFTLQANVKKGDSEYTKRKKISTAIATQKKRGTWQNDAKIRIDSITTYSSDIFRASSSDDWILCGDGVTENDQNYWASMGVDGIDDKLGIALIGDGTEIEIQGNIYINLHSGIYTAVLSAAQIAQIVDEISTDIVPAYMRIYLGYADITGSFNLYPGGIIG